MKFLYPQFLWALSALLIPIAVHLFNFRRYKTVYFSNTRLLRNVKQRTQSTKQLQKFLILCSRLLALALLVLAFAQPYFPATAEDNEDSQTIALYLDNSQSMAEEGLNGALLDEARTNAAEIVKALPANSQVQILNNNFEGKQQRYYSPSDALQLIDETQLSYATQTLTAVAQKAHALAQKEKIAQVKLLLLSDFQEGFIDETISNNQLEIAAVPFLAVTENANLAIDSVWLSQETRAVGIPQTINVKVSNYGNAEQSQSDYPVSLFLNEQLYGTKTVRLQNSRSAKIAFNFLPQNEVFYKGKISLEAPPPAFDNDFYFALNLGNKPQVEIIGSKSFQNTVQAVYSTKRFSVNTSSFSNANPQNIENSKVVVVEATDKPSSGIIASMKRSLEGGNTVLLFPGESVEPINVFLSELNLGQLGAASQIELRATELNWKDPIFKDAFLKETERPNLPVVKQYYPTGSLSPSLIRLVSFPNNNTLLSRGTYSQGTVVLSSTRLNSSWSNLGDHKVLVPTLINASRFSASNSPLYNYHASKQGQSFTVENADLDPISLELNGTKNILQQRQKGVQVEVYNLQPAIEPGSYIAYSGDSIVGQLAVNQRPAESNWFFTPKETLQENFELWKNEGNNLTAQVQASFVSNEYWQWILAGALLFFLLEIALIKLFE